MAAEAAADAEALGDDVALLLDADRPALPRRAGPRPAGWPSWAGPSRRRPRGRRRADPGARHGVPSPTCSSSWAATPSPREAAEAGVAEARRVGISRSTGAYLLSNRAEALIALGRWDEADAVCAEAARIDLPGVTGLHWLQLRRRAAAGPRPSGRRRAGRPGAGLPRPAVPVAEPPAAPARAGDRGGAGRGRQGRGGTGGRASRWPTSACRELPREGWPVLSAAARTAARVG